MNRIARLCLTACVSASASVMFGAGLAAAHIESDPAAVAAGSEATVGFAVEHGCDGSNTNEVQIKIPTGITDARPVDKPGWTAAASADSVTFSGGDLDADTPESFSITFTAPTKAGTVYFPIVQTCAAGKTAWIEIPAAGGPEPEHPAPAVVVTDGPPPSADPAPHDDSADGSSGADAESTASSGATVVTTAAPPTAVTTTAAADDDDSSSTVAAIAIVAGVVVVLGGAAVVAARRRRG